MIIWWSLVALLVFISFMLYHRRKSLLSVSQRAIIITGCDSGIGFEAAQVFHKLGFTVFAGCLSSFTDGAIQLKQISSDRLIILDLDVTENIKINNAVKIVAQHCQQNNFSVWALVNNAGICIGGDVEWQTFEQCEKQVNINFLGMVRMIKAFLPLIKLSKGRIVNVSSVNGRWVIPKLSMYCATKFAIEAFSTGLRIELSRFGVKVIVVAPGDHARITNIMKNQKTYANEQWNSFSEQFQEQVKDEFWAVQSNMSDRAGLTSFDRFEQSPVFKDMISAVLERQPKNHYTSASIVHRIGFLVLQNLPNSVNDFLLNKIQNAFTNGCIHEK